MRTTPVALFVMIDGHARQQRAGLSLMVPEIVPRVSCAQLSWGSMAATINVATRHRTTRDKRGMTDSLLDVKNVQSTTITSVVMAIG